MTEEPDEDKSHVLDRYTAASAPVRGVPSQASPPPQLAAQYPNPNLSLQDWMANNPQLTHIAQLLLQQHLQQYTQQATVQATAAPPPPPNSIPTAGDVSSTQAPTAHVPNGHRFGKVTVKGKGARVQQGNVYDTKTDHALLRTHTYEGVDIEADSVGANVNLGDMSHKGLGVFFNRGTGPSI